MYNKGVRQLAGVETARADPAILRPRLALATRSTPPSIPTKPRGGTRPAGFNIVLQTILLDDKSVLTR
jgi:hypothetical protein